jgi:hypothetical protein
MIVTIEITPDQNVSPKVCIRTIVLDITLGNEYFLFLEIPLEIFSSFTQLSWQMYVS